MYCRFILDEGGLFCHPIFFATDTRNTRISIPVDNHGIQVTCQSYLDGSATLHTSLDY
jgi:hypothetical protein